MTLEIPFGVANSISANFKFDPLDTIKFASQGEFPLLQIYLNQELLNNQSVLKKISRQKDDFKQVFFHAEGYLNEEFYESPYRQDLISYLETIEDSNFIIHFDERSNIDTMIKLVDKLGKEKPALYLENYFMAEGKEAAEKNLKKYMALFTLATNFGNTIYPVIDIPRIFHNNTGLSIAEALEWCYQMLNFFSLRNIPIYLHLIDASDPEQTRGHFVSLGQGYIPYAELFQFIKKTRPKIKGVIFEFEDKMNPLSSRDYIREQLG